MSYSLSTSLFIAQKREQLTHKPHYIVRCTVDTHWEQIATYQVTPRMPLIGEWYTSDGIQHGA